MCDPVTAAVVLTVAAGAVTAKGQYEEGKAARKAAEFDAASKDDQAKDAINRGNIEQEQQRQKTQQMLGMQRAAMGASGADVGSGSFGNVLVDTATTGEKDAQTIRTNALRSAWGLESEADILRFKGKQAERAGKMRAVGTILGTAGQAFGMSQMGGGGGAKAGASAGGAQNGGAQRVGGMGY